MPVVRASAEEMDGLTVYYRFLEKQYASETGVYREEIAKALLYALMLKLCEVYRREAGTASHVAKPRNEQLTDDFFRPPVASLPQGTEREVLCFPNEPHTEIPFRGGEAYYRPFDIRLD